MDGYKNTMFLVDLVCGDGHLFEGWYDNRQAFEDVRLDGDLCCPVCQSTDIDLRPSFRAIISRSSSSSSSSSSSAAPAPASPSAADTSDPPAMPLEVQRALSQLLKQVRATTEDAGERFAERAIAMHRGDEEPAAIHGTSTPEERARLLDEGVPFVALPVPDIDQN